jgi:hypothetical protein
MKKINPSNDSTSLLNDIWRLKEELNDPNLSMLDIITEYIERHNLDPDDIGEILAQNKNFVKILENELIKAKVFKSKKEINSFDCWE